MGTSEKTPKYPKVIVSMSRNIVDPKYRQDINGCLHRQGFTKPAERDALVNPLFQLETLEEKRQYLETLFTVID